MRRYYLGAVALLLVICTAQAIFAAPAPIPISAVGSNKAIYVSTTATPHYLVSNGGGFFGTVSSNQTILWCVDSQYYISSGANNYKGDVVLLSDIAANPNQVHFGNVTGAGWTAVNFGDAAKNNATARYKMAAYLIEQYTNFSTNPLQGPSPTQTRDVAIQGAIWWLMKNNANYGGAVGTNPGGTSLDPNGPGDQDREYWIAEASAHYTEVQHTWAVVSGGVLGSDPWNIDTTKAYQTFLVAVVPEPGFYGLLALGLSGLFCAVRRRTVR